MKNTWSKKWKASRQPRKQRKYRVNAPLHIARHFMSASFSKDLRKKYRKRNIPLRKGDSVKIMSGDFKGKMGKSDRIDLVYRRVYVE